MANEAFAYSPEAGESTFSFRDGDEEQDTEVFQVPFGAAGNLFTLSPIENARPTATICGTVTFPPGGGAPSDHPTDRAD